MDLPRLEDLPLKKGQRALVRVDLNVPLRDGVVEDDLRITTALPTINWLRERGAVVVVAGHLGRPKGVVDPQYSMAPVAARLRELLDCDVQLAPAVYGPRVEPLVASSSPGDVVLLENLRFDPGETENDPAFAINLAELGDVYVNEAFGASHRAHASIVGPPPILPHAGGRLLHREVEVLSKLLADDVGRPFVAVLGGAKVSDKLGVIEALLNRCDKVLIGGAMAFTFLLAMRTRVGDSLVQPEMVEECNRLLATGRVEIPTDFVIAQDVSADADDPHRELRVDPRRLEGPRHRARDRGHLRRHRHRGQDGALERAHGHVRARAVRGRHPHRRRGGRRLARVHRRRWRRQRGGHPRVRSRRPGRPRQHRWRRVARVHRAGRPPRPAAPSAHRTKRDD